MTRYHLFHGLVHGKVHAPPDAPAHRLLTAGDFRLLVSPAPVGGLEDAQSAANAALHHNKLLCCYGEVADLVPVRFGTLYLDDADLCANITEQTQLFQASLDRVAGAREFAIQLTPARVDRTPPEDTRQSLTGREYLRHKRDMGTARDEARSRQNALVSGIVKTLCRDVRDLVVDPPAADRLASLSVLVDRAEEGAFIALARDIYRQVSGSGIAMKITGPWPPYGFVTQPGVAQ